MYTIKLNDWAGFETKSIDIPESQFNGGNPITKPELQRWAEQGTLKFKQTVKIFKDGELLAQHSILNDML